MVYDSINKSNLELEIFPIDDTAFSHPITSFYV